MSHNRFAASVLCVAITAGCAFALAGCGSDDAAAATTGGSPQGASGGAQSSGSQSTAGTGTEQRAARFRNMANSRLAEDVPRVPVAVAEVRRGVVEAYYRGSTNLTAAEEAVVVARTLGVVEALFVEEGDVVEAGQPLAQLETERLQLEVERSRTQLANLKAAYERAERLNASQMISPTEYDAARFGYRTELTNLRLREYELREATIRATIGGVITRRHIKVGHTLNQNAPAFEMKRLDSIEAELNVPEREIQRIRSGQFARVIVDALPDDGFEGEVTRVAPEVDPTSGTFRVTVTLDNADGRLKPGMFGRVDVRTDVRADALLTPLEAVVTLRDRSSLFVVSDDIAERRQVTTGYVSDGNIEILTGAREGEQVVMTGQDGLRDGTRVSIVEGYAAPEPS
ncbi:MAG: efflux RND transporter periplasmic adaptor subunit [Gammaproteobacteria bacterium]|nr:efflux RND transporter periplasmic adaptor subunit [Gammaproteobacteria bacterium]